MCGVMTCDPRSHKHSSQKLSVLCLTLQPRLVPDSGQSSAPVSQVLGLQVQTTMLSLCFRFMHVCLLRFLSVYTYIQWVCVCMRVCMHLHLCIGGPRLTSGFFFNMSPFYSLNAELVQLARLWIPVPEFQAGHQCPSGIYMDSGDTSSQSSC